MGFTRSARPAIEDWGKKTLRAMNTAIDAPVNAIGAMGSRFESTVIRSISSVEEGMLERQLIRKHIY
jgi:hypothetical protein